MNIEETIAKMVYEYWPHAGSWEILEGSTKEECRSLARRIMGLMDAPTSPATEHPVERRGHPRFFELLDEMALVHERKNAGYAGIDNPDPLANFRGSEKLGIPAWKGGLIRLGDKYERAINLARNPSNEQVGEALEDTLLDLANYALLIICLIEESVQ
jgi:hypothetical protein